VKRSDRKEHKHDDECRFEKATISSAAPGISGVKVATVSASEYDMVVIGSGPAGQKMRHRRGKGAQTSRRN